MLAVLLFLVTGVVLGSEVTNEYFGALVDKVITRDVQVDSVIDTTTAGDKQVCGTCHSDKSSDFRKSFQHAPFLNWYCTDCHVPHSVGSGKSEFVVDVQKLCSSCHFDRKGEMTMGHQHMPFGKGLCTDCHDPHASDYPKLLILDQKTLCATCHFVSSKYGFEVQHGPYAKGNCSDCHTPHASNYKGLTTLPGKELCFSCHYDHVRATTLPVQHEPYGTGDCVGCHGPHATPNDDLLLLAPDKLCFSCHSEHAQQTKVGFQHKPFNEGNCQGCHTPHASTNNALVLRTKSELCYMCHGEMRNKFQGVSFHPVGNGLLECNGCHAHHASPGDKLTWKEGNQLCYTCHPGLQEGYEKLAHATKADGRAGIGKCLNCHEAHNSNEKPLLLDKQEQMCNKCHGEITERGMQHPVGEKYKDPWRGTFMRCSSCHGPHGTEYENFTRLPHDGLCLKCHGVKRKGVWEIHKKLDKSTW